MKSKVHMHLDNANKIVKVQDKWNGKLPDNTLLNVLPFLSLKYCFSKYCGASPRDRGDGSFLGELMLLLCRILWDRRGRNSIEIFGGCFAGKMGYE